MNTNLLKKAFVSAIGTAVYAMMFAWFMNNAQGWFGVQPNWLVMALLLIIFIISACITGALVLLRPILLYIEGQKNEAVRLFGYTVGILVVIVVLVGVALTLSNSKNDSVVFCTQDAKLCSDGSYVGRTGPNCEFVCPGE